jgi:hypothetical protein
MLRAMSIAVERAGFGSWIQTARSSVDGEPPRRVEGVQNPFGAPRNGLPYRRDRELESGSLQRGVCKPSVPRERSSSGGGPSMAGSRAITNRRHGPERASLSLVKRSGLDSIQWMRCRSQSPERPGPPLAGRRHSCSRRVSVTGGLNVPLPGAGPRVIGNQTTPSSTGNPTSRPGC